MTSPDILNSSDVAAITKVREAWLAAINADNLPGMQTLLSADCIVFPPNEAPLVGSDANNSWHQARVSQFRTDLTISSDELVGSGSWAFERQSFRIKLTPKTGGNPVQDSGHGMWVWHREAGGSWKVVRAIWNSEHPIPAVT